MAAAFSFESSVDAHLSTGMVQSVVLDLARVDFVDSAGLGALLSIRDHARRRGIELRLAVSQALDARSLPLQASAPAIDRPPEARSCREIGRVAYRGRTATLAGDQGVHARVGPLGPTRSRLGGRARIGARRGNSSPPPGARRVANPVPSAVRVRSARTWCSSHQPTASPKPRRGPVRSGSFVAAWRDGPSILAICCARAVAATPCTPGRRCRRVTWSGPRSPHLGSNAQPRHRNALRKSVVSVIVQGRVRRSVRLDRLALGGGGLTQECRVGSRSDRKSVLSLAAS